MNRRGCKHEAGEMRGFGAGDHEREASLWWTFLKAEHREDFQLPG